MLVEEEETELTGFYFFFKMYNKTLLKWTDILTVLYVLLTKHDIRICHYKQEKKHLISCWSPWDYETLTCRHISLHAIIHIIKIKTWIRLLVTLIKVQQSLNSRYSLPNNYTYKYKMIPWCLLMAILQYSTDTLHFLNNRYFAHFFATGIFFQFQTSDI